MNLTVVLNVITGTDFKVRNLARIRQVQSKMCSNISPLRLGGSQQIDPDRLDAFKILATLNRYLPQSPILQFKGVHLAFIKDRLPGANQLLAKLI